ncbi:hypothetical protein DT075_03165 [Bacillus licheniformis]|nr:hypothetical protein DT075_03165 [Bacillus licheniformis]
MFSPLAGGLYEFPLYYASLFPTAALGNQIFGYLNSFQVFIEAGMMFLAPFIVNKLGPKKSLILAGLLMAFRIIGSGLWVASASAIILVAIIVSVKIEMTDDEKERADSVGLKDVGGLFLLKDFWFLMLYVIGVTCVYGVYDQQLGAIVGGIYLGTAFLAGIGAIETFIEKVSRKYQFEYGRTRMWGSLGWAAATFFAGQLFNIDPNINLNLNGSATGIIFSVNAIFTLCMQPLYGFISDKLGLKKNILFMISLLLVFTGPFYIFVYGPLLQYNVLPNATF